MLHLGDDEFWSKWSWFLSTKKLEIGVNASIIELKSRCNYRTRSGIEVYN